MKSRKYKDYHRTNINNIEEKQCKDCLEWFEMTKDNFRVDNGNKDKFSMMCEKCQIIWQKSYYAKTRESQLEKAKEYRRVNKTEAKRRIKEHYDNNKETYYINSKKYKEEHQTEVTAKEVIWSDNNREKLNGYSRDRQQHKTHRISNKEFQNCKEYFDNKCAYCGVTEEEHKKLYGQQLHKDHAYNNGSNNITNCIISCKSCNARKRKKDFNEWYIPDNPRFEEGFYKQENYDRIIKWLEEDCFTYLNPKHKD